MGMKMTTTESEIATYIDSRCEAVRKAMIRAMQYAGERCVNEARRAGSYTDRTGNLRSSVGYVLSVDGRIVADSGFESVSATGEAGGRSGRSYAREVARRFPEGIVLVVVAGMNYASYVADTGRDVIDSAELLADRLVPQILRQIINAA